MKLHDLYTNTHSSWLHENTTRDQCHQTDEWFMGKTLADDFIPCLTTKDTVSVTGLNINKYSVIYTKDLKPGVLPAVKPGAS